MNRLICISLVLIALLLGACTQNISVRTSLSDNVLMGIRSSGSRGASFSYDSLLKDNRLPIYGQNKQPLSGGPKYTSDQVMALERMLGQYLGNKFGELSPFAALKLHIQLADFYVERYSLDSGFIRTIAFLDSDYSGLTYRNNAVVSVVVNLEHEGEIITRMFTASGEVDSAEGKELAAIAEAINLANNRLLILLNAFLAEHEL